MKEFEIFSTTADVGIKIWGKEYGDLYKNAICAFNTLIFGNGYRNQMESPTDSTSHSFFYKGDSSENVLVNLLSEIIFLVYSRQKMVWDIIIEEADIDHLHANLMTKPLDVAPAIEVKSVTYHNLRIVNNRNTKETEIVFDI